VAGLYARRGVDPTSLAHQAIREWPAASVRPRHPSGSRRPRGLSSSSSVGASSPIVSTAAASCYRSTTCSTAAHYSATSIITAAAAASSAWFACACSRVSSSTAAAAATTAEALRSRGNVAGFCCRDVRSAARTGDRAGRPGRADGLPDQRIGGTGDRPVVVGWGLPVQARRRCRSGGRGTRPGGACCPGRSSPADVVAVTITQAATARRPRARYPTGRSARSIVRARRFLPDRAMNAVIRRTFP